MSIQPLLKCVEMSAISRRRSHLMITTSWVGSHTILTFGFQLREKRRIIYSVGVVVKSKYVH